MKKTIAIILALLLLSAAGCAKDESSTFTHGIYEVAYQTEPTTTEDGQPAVKVVYTYYRHEGKKKDASTLGMVFVDGGIYGMYLQVDGLAYGSHCRVAHRRGGRILRFCFQCNHS